MKRSNNQDVKAFLAIKLQEICHPSSPVVAEEALDAIFNLVVQHPDDEALKDSVVSVGAIQVIVDATRRPSASPQFLHRALGTFSYLAESSKERSVAIVNQGGLGVSLEIMHKYMFFAYLLITCMLFQVTLLRSVADETRPSIAESIFQNSVQAMQHHEQDAQIYRHACSVLAMCCGPGVHIDAELVDRAVQCTFDGVLRHRRNEDAQMMGLNLLVHFVGPVVARRVMDHVEMHHCEEDECSGSA